MREWENAEFANSYLKGIKNGSKGFFAPQAKSEFQK
jgi:hypothetical protein